eukprot:Colp12_sorted_trinity150504_noHs@10453
MQYIRSPVSTLCIGHACSMGSLLLTAGEPGMRYILPNARVMIHQPRGGMEGTVSDIAIAAKEYLRTRDQMNQLYVKHTGRPVNIIEEAVDRDRWLDPQEALEFGLVDKIMMKRDEDTTPKA